jgi:acetyl-CoA synthetase
MDLAPGGPRLDGRNRTSRDSWRCTRPRPSPSLRERAAKDTAWFWDAAMKDIGLSWFAPYKQVRDDSAGFPWTKWFLGGKINVTYNCIDRHCLAGYGDETAIYYEADSDAPEDRRKISYRQLAKSVNRCANAMRAAGASAPGDAIGLYAPMRVETVIVSSSPR